MTSKLVYFLVQGKLEKAQFSEKDDPEDVKELFRSAAAATRRDVIKLYTSSGALIAISPRLMANPPEQPYRLEVVVCCPRQNAKFVTEGGRSSLTDLESRLVCLEEVVQSKTSDRGTPPDWLQPLAEQVEDLRKKLQRLEHLSWMGLSKSPGMDTALGANHTSPSTLGSNNPCKTPSNHQLSGTSPNVRRSEKECQAVWHAFQKLRNSEMSTSLRESLRLPTFDNWNWEDAELLLLVRQMFIDLDLHTKFRIPLPVLEQWIMEIYRHYNVVPFHNFSHAFTVTQMMYSVIWLCELPSRLSDLDLLTLLFSALCHDLDHPGYNNTYQVNAKTALALRYNDLSPLENHHCSVAFQIVASKGPESDILAALTPVQMKRLRDCAIKCILATDMARHNEIVVQFRDILPQFDWSNTDHVILLMMVIIKVCDISNEVRPNNVSDPWLDCLLEEFFRQSDTEKLEGLPVAPFMDRDKVTKWGSQCGFIRFVILPLFEPLVQLFPQAENAIVSPVRKHLEYYTDMEQRHNEAVQSGIKNGLTSSGGSRKSSTGSMDRPVAAKT